MVVWRQGVDALNATAELRAFLRAELAHVVAFDKPDGGRWNPYAIAAEIRASDDIPGQVSDDTIARFLANPDYRPGPGALRALAGFLLAFDFIAQSDLALFETTGYDRAATALGQLFGEAAAPGLARDLAGSYRAYRLLPPDRLAQTVLTLASPDQGGCLVVREARAIYRLSDPAFVLAETGNLDPALYHRLPELLEEPDVLREARTLGTGAGVATAAVIFLAIGGLEVDSHGLLLLDELHADREGILGCRGQRARSWVQVSDGTLLARDAPGATARLLAGEEQDLELYRQGRAAGRLPAFERERLPAYDSSRGRFGFQTTNVAGMTDGEQKLIEAEQASLRLEEAFAACPDATARLALSIRVMRVDRALQALAEGADLSAAYAEGSPMLHAAAARGMRALVEAVLAREDCELTQRDRRGRLAAACADNGADDFGLRDRLIEAQTARFRQRGIDPRRPSVPGYGSFILRSASS